MITEEHIKEALSVSYIHALAGKAGLNVTTARRHDYGVDGTFHQVIFVGGYRCEAGFSLDFQAKASIDWSVTDSKIIYDLDAAEYTDLVTRARTTNATPKILILLCMHRDPNTWLDCTVDSLIMRKCCYWYRPTGPDTTNTGTVRIKIPEQQHLTPTSLNDLMNLVSSGQFL